MGPLLLTRLLELNETLYGKYGEDAEQLIFSAQHGRSSKDETSMRYDLTVPLARLVAQYESQLTFPFKRYQIAPVFRGERPQKGRYREFYQCDVDIVGVQSMSADAEMVGLVSAVLGRARMEVSNLLKLGPGTVLELDRKVGEAIDIYVNNRLVARGEVVLVEDKLGVTMTEIIKAERS